MRRALGKGLAQMLAEVQPDVRDEKPTQLPVGKIVPNPRQPRGRFDDDALAELSASIREFGVLQPLIVRTRGDGSYELIAGERRLRASKLAGIKEVPVIVRTANAQASLEIALVENVQRADISPVDCALAYKKLADEFGMGQEQIAARVGKSRAAVANTMRLLKLPEDMLEALAEEMMTEGHARAILMADGPARQRVVFDRVIDESLSVREAERIARQEPRTPGPETKNPKPGSRKSSPEYVALERVLSEHFGAPVHLAKGEKGGKITVDYYSDDDLQRILDVLGVSL